MTTAATLQEYLFSFHGMPLRYATSCPALIGPATTLLQHCRCDRVGRDPLTIQFEEVENRRDVPVCFSSSAPQLFSGTKPALGDALRQSYARWEARAMGGARFALEQACRDAGQLAGRKQ